MQPITTDDSLSSLKSVTTWLIFFVDGGDDTAKEIAAVLESYSDAVPEKNIVIMSTQYNSVLHMQFEDVYGPSPVNSVTFVLKGGAACIRWDGHGHIEDVIEDIFGIDGIPDTNCREFGYPTEEAVRHFMLDNSDSEEVSMMNGSASSLDSEKHEKQPSVEKEMQSSLEKEMQPSLEKEMPPSLEKEMQPSGSSEKKSIRQQSKEVTVLQIRCPDGSSVTQTFKTSSLLSEVREMIAAHFSLSDGFGLATSYPRYHYANEDYCRNLSDLDLWPNAVLLIVPADPRQVNNTTSLWTYTANFSSWIYTLMIYMWASVRSFFPFTGATNSQPATHASERQNSPQPGPSGSRRHGNVHTLRDTEKDDDKRRTTYNGNSTQQL